MNLTPLNGFVSGISCIVTVFIIIQWWVDTHGSWRQSVVGRSFMGLLAVTALLTGRTAIISFIPGPQGTPIVNALFHIMLTLAVLYVGYARRSIHVGAVNNESKVKS